MADFLKVSDVARLLRLSSDSIRFYEKRGIIHPRREGDNQYRFFHLEDIRRLYDCKIFQNIGFTITEIEAITNTKTPEEISEMLMELQKKVHGEIARQNTALHKIKRLLESIGLVNTMQGKYLIQMSPHIKMYFYASNNHFDSDSVADPGFQTVMDYYNLFDCSVVIKKEYAFSPDVDERGTFGFSINMDMIRQWDVPLDNPQLEIPSKTCVYTAFISDGILSAEDLSGAFAWMKRRNLQLSDDIFCIMRRLSFDYGVDRRYYEMWLPIEEDEPEDDRNAANV